jgi:hypothetical protein
MSNTIKSGQILTKSEDIFDLNDPYREAIGALMVYQTGCNKHIGLCSQALLELWHFTLVADKRIIRYLNTANNFRLTNGVDIQKVSNAMLTPVGIGDLDTRSTTGYITKLNGNLISLKSQRQHTVPPLKQSI